jgi:hypothetical protein
LIDPCSDSVCQTLRLPQRNEGPSCSTYLLLAIGQRNSLAHWLYLTHPTRVISSCAHYEVGAPRSRHRLLCVESAHEDRLRASRNTPSSRLSVMSKPENLVQISTLLNLGHAIDWSYGHTTAWPPASRRLIINFRRHAKSAIGGANLYRHGSPAISGSGRKKSNPLLSSDTIYFLGRQWLKLWQTPLRLPIGRHPRTSVHTTGPRNAVKGVLECDCPPSYWREFLFLIDLLLLDREASDPTTSDLIAVERWT